MSGLNWRGIGIAIAVGLVGSMAMSLLFDAFLRTGEDGTRPMWVILLFSYGLGTLLDVGIGAIAGGIARTRGALHGLVAGVITSLLSPLIGLLLQAMRGMSFADLPLGPYLAAMAFGVLMGTVLATIGGVIGAAVMRRRAPTA